MRRLIVVNNPRLVKEKHIAQQRAKMSDRERQRIEDAEIMRDLWKAQQRSDGELKSLMRHASNHR